MTTQTSATHPLGVDFLPDRIVVGIEEQSAEALRGVWVGVFDDEPTRIHFGEGGALKYEIQTSQGSIQIIDLQYHVEDGFIVTRQGPQSDVERTAFKVHRSTLTLRYGGETTVFRRSV